jgi:hypothetical protein
MAARDRNLFLLICVGNLILASFFFLVMLMGEAGCRSALSSSPPRLHHGPVTIREIAMDSITLVWFAGAVGLFSRRRLAWVGSLVGVGALACAFAAILATVAGLHLSSSGELMQYQGVARVSHIFAITGIAGFCLVLFAVSLGLFIGLLRMRKELR